MRQWSHFSVLGLFILKRYFIWAKNARMFWLLNTCATNITTIKYRILVGDILRHSITWHLFLGLVSNARLVSQCSFVVPRREERKRKTNDAFSVYLLESSMSALYREAF